MKFYQNKKTKFSVLVASIILLISFGLISAEKETQKASFSREKNSLITQSRQITFVGPRSGEGYFSADGKKMIFQSERVDGNPFYQMFLLDLDSGKTQLLSTGKGKTTCGWIHPKLNKVMWSSTHLDPQTDDKAKAEYAERLKPVKGRYSWSFDENFEIFESDLKGKKIKQLTKTQGYDAEGAYSSNGEWIVFASNRSMYPTPVSDVFTDEQKKFLDKDPSFAMEIYKMKSDGSDVQRLTKSPGYDGGPFFSADGKKITWRRFTPDGSKAEIYSMNTDGSEQTQLTRLGSMSWAPFFHPSGQYIIFASSVLGFSNFELFIVDAKGLHEPVQVTFSEGFDGLASFSPDGKTMTWSHRNEKGESQIYLANWDHEQALKLLGLSISDKTSLELPTLSDKKMNPINEVNSRAIVQYLASELLQGRPTGSEYEIKYTIEIARLFKSLGLKPLATSEQKKTDQAAGQTMSESENPFIQTFEFTSSIKATEKNSAELHGRLSQKLNRGKDYQVLSYSKTGSFPAAPIVFAGYGIVAPATEKLALFDSYKDLSPEKIQGKWVVVLDGVPENKEKEIKHQLLAYSRPQYKITLAKNKGAAGVIFVSYKKDLASKEIPFEGSLSETTIPVLKISSTVLDSLLKPTAYPSYEKLIKTIDTSTSQNFTGFLFDSQYLSAEVDLIQQRSTGRNVVGVLYPESSKKNLSKALLVGAHGDHLGRGDFTGSSLAKPDEKNQIHFGADDNASGVSGVLQLAAYYSQPENRQKLKKPIYFAIWSGEEIGVLGSSHFVKDLNQKDKNKFKQTFEAGLNMDMIGRFRDQLQVQGVGSANEWSGLAEEVGLLTGVPMVLTQDPYLPTDSMSFYLAEIPSISFFTGSHEDYHSPRDKVETLNYTGLVKSISVVKKFIDQLTSSPGQLVHYEKIEANKSQKLEGRQFRIYLGTIPDYSQEGIKGVRISGASKNSPAEIAGLKAGDIIVELDKTKIENLYDYVYILQAIKPKVATQIHVIRQGQNLVLDITPALKE